MTKLDEFAAANTQDPARANRMLLHWLSDDDDRADLYRGLTQPLRFASCADIREGPHDVRDAKFGQPAYLLTRKEDIAQAFTKSEAFSNSPFRDLGSGTFMLALDPQQAPPADHQAQRKFAQAYLQVDAEETLGLITAAFQAAAVLPLKQGRFDLAELAEQIALRYMGLLFGFGQGDHVMLEGTMRKAYRGLSYQMMARNFVFEPQTVPEASAAMALLAKRVAELIGLYQQPLGLDQIDERERIDAELEELQDFTVDTNPHDKRLCRFEPLLRRIAQHRVSGQAAYSNTEAAVIVVGLVAGAVGNIQASICIAMQQFFRLDAANLMRVTEIARRAWAARREASSAPDDRELEDWIWEALRVNPPASFLPRKAIEDIRLGGTTIAAGHLILLGVGGATRVAASQAADGFKPPAPRAREAAAPAAACPHAAHRPDPHAGRPTLIFGGSPADTAYTHSCVGQYLSMPSVVHAVRQLLVLPGLAEALDPRTGKVSGLRKLWGYNCETYPFEFRRDAILTQSPLSVVMRVKQPVAQHAEALKQVLRYGAPRIEKRLKEARHVHFAHFLFLENDTKLALFTVYDRDFDSYIEHFALQIGPLFDRIFEHIQDAPPLPVDEFPKEFVDAIRRYNQAPAAGYFFSAYPNADASTLSQAHQRRYP